MRRAYGEKEARLLLGKMRSGQVVPKLRHEECMLLMLEVWSDPELTSVLPKAIRRWVNPLIYMERRMSLSRERQQSSGGRHDR